MFRERAMRYPPEIHQNAGESRTGLRGWRVEDAPRLVQAWDDADIATYSQVPPQPTLATATRWINGIQERLDRHLALDMVIEADGAVVGEVGLSGFSANHRGALIGYWLLPEARGKGLASRSVREFCEWAHATLELTVIVAQCSQDNLASQNVARRAGFTHETNDPSGNQLWRSRTRD